MDNNQKGQPCKFQRDGCSNIFIKATGRIFKGLIPFKCDNKTELVDIHGSTLKVPITYIDQAIPSMYCMSPFEDFVNLNFRLPPIKPIHNTTTTYCERVMDIVLHHDYSSLSNNRRKIDFCGKRVDSYKVIIDLCGVVQHIIQKYCCNHELKMNEYKTWMYQPISHQSQFRMKIAKLFSSSCATILPKYISFQTISVKTMIPNIDEETKLIVPKVSSCDEIKTDGFGMSLIEIMVLVGILIEKEETPTTTKQWLICNEYESIVLYLTMDGLSLDRYKSFRKKLRKIPQLFSNNYQQSIHFQKALSCAVENSGPLHVAFHMLQVVYIVFNVLLKNAIGVIEWKKIQMSKVSDCFQSTKAMALLLLEQCERYLVDEMICGMTQQQHQELMMSSEKDVFPLLFSRMYIDFLKDNSWTEHNNT